MRYKKYVLNKVSNHKLWFWGSIYKIMPNLYKLLVKAFPRLKCKICDLLVALFKNIMTVYGLWNVSLYCYILWSCVLLKPSTLFYTFITGNGEWIQVFPSEMLLKPNFEKFIKNLNLVGTLKVQKTTTSLLKSTKNPIVL